jgi:NAD(P)-dependent dehydrogenase (short-subunit alcohol dehydrogenase family)
MADPSAAAALSMIRTRTVAPRQRSAPGTEAKITRVTQQGRDSLIARDLRDAVVVITGASSGIGRCAAISFARCGSRLILAARSAGALRDSGAACESEGAQAVVVPTDVRDESAVQDLARTAVAHFGRIDVWVNSAGVIAYGPFEQVPSAAPIFANAANYSGRRPRPIPPLLTAEKVADGILRSAREPQREVTYGSLGRAVESLHSLWPELYERLAPPAFSAGNYATNPVPDTSGNVLAARGSHGVDGAWRRDHRRELLRAARSAARAGIHGLLHGPGS